MNYLSWVCAAVLVAYSGTALAQGSEQKTDPLAESPDAAPKPDAVPKTETSAAAESEDWGGDFEQVGAGDVKKENPAATFYSEAYPRADRVFDVFTARALRRGTWVSMFSHRNNGALRDQPFAKFLGFDGGGLKIGLGLRYGVLDGLDVGVLRLNGTAEIYDTYELDARYQFLRQEKHWLDMAVRGGYTWFFQPGHPDASGVFGQLLLTHLFFDRLLISTGILFHSNSSNDMKTQANTNYSLAWAGAAEFRIIENLAWGFEIAQTVAGYHSKWPVMTTGPKLVTNRHTFSVVVSNSQYTSADSTITGTRRGVKDMVLGFNITREL